MGLTSHTISSIQKVGTFLSFGTFCEASSVSPRTCFDHGFTNIDQNIPPILPSFARLISKCAGYTCQKHLEEAQLARSQAYQVIEVDLADIIRVHLPNVDRQVDVSVNHPCSAVRQRLRVSLVVRS